MTSGTDNSNNPDYREYYLLNTWWGNDWNSAIYCGMCGCNFNPDKTGNVYKVIKEGSSSITFFCQSDYFEIQHEHKKEV